MTPVLRRRLSALLLPLLLLATPALPGARAIDLHAYWDDRCKSCHGESAAFARRSLSAQGTRLIGVHHRDDLERFLRQHYMADDMVAPVTRMLVAQVNSPPLFQQHCAGCHGRAADFARQSLVMNDGVLTGKVNKAPVAATLRAHGGLAPHEIAPMLATLERVLREVQLP